MPGRFLIPFLCALLLAASPALAGYAKDSCPQNKPQNRVRADMVFDLQTGRIISEKNGEASFHPASLSKIMALAIVYQDLKDKRLRLSDTVQLVKTGGQFDGRTRPISRMTVREAIDGVATASLNNALDGLAAKVGTADFVRRMNEQAKLWGMRHTVFVNPTGWPTPEGMKRQRTNLYDLARLLRGVWLTYPKETLQFSGKPEVRIAGLKNPLKSTNNLLETSTAPRAKPYKGVVAGKTGYTCYSGWHLIAVYEDEELGGRRMVAMTVGHASGKARDDHMRKMLDAARPKFRAFVRQEEQRIRKEEEARARQEAALHQSDPPQGQSLAPVMKQTTVTKR